MTYWGLSDKGTIIRTLIIKKKGYYAYNIIHRISARRVMDNHDFVGLFNTKKYNELKKKFNLKIIRDFMNSSQEIGDCIFRYYLSNICNDGKICTLSEAIKRIDMCEYHSENTDILKKFIEFSNRFRSAAKAVTLYREFFDRKEVNRIIWMLYNIDGSFVTATTEVVKLFDRRYIPTPLELYEEWCDM